MSEWVDIAVYAALIVAVWGWFPAWSSRLTIPLIADRNPDWLADHPESERRLVESRWFRRSCLLCGSLSLLTLLAFQVDVWPPQLAFLRAAPKWEALKDLNSTLFIAGLIYIAACAVMFFRWLDTNVPLSSRRQATLERRSLHDYVPGPLQFVVYAVIVLHLTVWAVVAMTGRSESAAFWGMAFQFAIAGVFLLFVLTAVRRRPGATDRIFGPGYRRTQVRAAFAAQLLPLPNGIARLYEQVASFSSDNLDRFTHLGLVLLVVALAMTLAAWSRQRGAPGSARWARSATSAGALAFVLSMTMAHGVAQDLPRTDSDDEIRKVVAGPLGMSSTGIMLSPAMRARLAAGHNRFLEPAPHWDSPTVAGAGALRSTVNDMLTFLAAALDLERSTLAPAFALTTSARRSPSPAFDVGLGWGIAKNRGTEIMFVNGRSGGYRTWLGYEPRTRSGVVVLTNADGVIGADDIGRHVLNPDFPLVQTFHQLQRRAVKREWILRFSIGTWAATSWRRL